jgi:hypothetical protein
VEALARKLQITTFVGHVKLYDVRVVVVHQTFCENPFFSARVYYL